MEKMLEPHYFNFCGHRCADSTNGFTVHVILFRFVVDADAAPSRCPAYGNELWRCPHLESETYSGYMGMMEKKMEATIAYWGYIGIMDKKMETWKLL